MDTNKLINLILYGDVHETPLNILGNLYKVNTSVVFDDEQNTRLAIAATLKDLITKGELKIS